jgi:4-hydroxy-tetrahydrodipicolinate synthase
VVETVSSAIGGRVPFAVTVAEPSVPGQVAFMRHAEAHGADWVILQLPSIRGATEADLVAFLAAVARESALPVAIQNNPVNMDVAISNDSLLSLHRDNPNISIMKAEAAAVSVQTLAAVKTLSVFGGRNGVEIITSLRSGCVGNVPAPEVAGELARIFELMKTGDAAAELEALSLYRRILPLIVFVGQGLPTQICYGKQLVAQRLGLRDVHSRTPGLKPTAFGLETVRRLYSAIEGNELIPA